MRLRCGLCRDEGGRGTGLVIVNLGIEKVSPLFGMGMKGQDIQGMYHIRGIGAWMRSNGEWRILAGELGDSRHGRLGMLSGGWEIERKQGGR